MTFHHRRFRRWTLIVVIPHAMMGWLFLIPFLGMLSTVWSRSDFQPATFVVTGHHETSGRHQGRWPYLQGTVDGHREVHRPSGLLSMEELRQAFPMGTQLEVLYHPNASGVMMQGQTLRVISPDGFDGAL